MTIAERLARVPDYNAFYTVDELYAHASCIAARYPDICTLRIIGYSKAGKPIIMTSVGDGPAPLLLFAFPHPNEPVGAMLTYFLLEELMKEDELRAGRTWHIIPCIDPDGASLNEGWFKGPFSIRDYARHYFRTKGEDQVEWSFPIEYKTLKYEKYVPETKALMNAIAEIKPLFMYSLHNSSFGGVYYYISKPLKEVYEALYRIPEERDLPLSLGEPEMPYCQVYSPAIFDMPRIKDAYDYYEKIGVADPAKHIHGGASSRDFADGISEPLTLVTEVPLFLSPQIADTTKTDRTRKELTLKGLEKSHRILCAVKSIIDETIGELTKGEIIRDTVVAFVEQMATNIEDTKTWVNTDPEMENKATSAQAVDAEYISVFRNLTILSMYRRALKVQMDKGASRKLANAFIRLDDLIELWITKIEGALDYRVVSIKHMVEVQYGALLAVLEALGI